MSERFLAFPGKHMTANSSLRIAVIGGGAAGFFSAIACAEANPEAQVILLEATPRLLTKVKISGGGRCNVTHHCFDTAKLVTNYPRGFRELRGPFSRFQPRDTVAWFEERGVPLKTEEDGRMFPVSDQSESIIRCLIEHAEKAKVQIRKGAFLKKVEKLSPETLFKLHFQKDEALTVNKILLATGSAPIGYEIAKSLGHPIEPPVPSLFTFEVNDSRLDELSGLSFPSVELTLKAADQTFKQTGPLLITHWGLSGPAVLKLSAWGARALHEASYRAQLAVSFLSHLDLPHTVEILKAARQQLGQKTIRSHTPFDLPKRFWQRLIEMQNISDQLPWTQMSNGVLQNLAEQISKGVYSVLGKGPFKEEFVTCGGVSLKDVDFKTMASRLCPGLYFAGEILDIDGITGGFNFQAAWTTGWIAGQNLAQAE